MIYQFSLNLGPAENHARAMDYIVLRGLVYWARYMNHSDKFLSSFVELLDCWNEEILVVPFNFKELSFKKTDPWIDNN